MRYKVFLYDLSLYLVIGVVYLANEPLWSSSDTMGTKYLPISILVERNLDLNEFAYLEKPEVSNLQWVNGKLRSTYPIGTALLATPGYFLGWLMGVPFHDGGVDRLARLAADLITLAAVIVMHRWYLRKADRMSAALFTLAMGLGTSLWSICSDDLWQHTGVVLSLAVFCYFVGWSYPTTSSHRVMSGLALGFAVVCRPTTGLFALIFLVWLIPKGFKAVCQATLGLALSASCHFLYNLAAYGSFLGGYALLSSRVGWDAPNLAILGKLLGYPSRGLLIYCPVLILTYQGIILAVRNHEAVIYRLSLLSVAVHLVLISSWRIWDGGVNYGPRLLTDALPYCGVLAAPAFLNFRFKRLRSWFIILLLAGSIAIQALGAFRYDGSYLYRFGWDLSKSEIVYVATGGTNEIIYPRNPECVACSSILNLSLPESSRYQLFGFRANGYVNPHALVGFNPPHDVETMTITIETLPNPGLLALDLTVMLNRQPIATRRFSELGRTEAIPLTLTSTIRPGTLNLLDFHFHLQRSPAFHFVGEYNTVSRPVARIPQIDLSR